MKNLITLCLLITALVSCKTEPTQFTITGNLGADSPVKEVKVRLDRDTTDFAKTSVVDGKFTLTGTIDYPRMALLHVGDGINQIVLENANYQVETSGNYKYLKGGTYHNMVFGYTQDPTYIERSKEVSKMSKEAFKDIEFGDLEALEKANKTLRPYRQKVRDIKNKHLASILESDSSPTLAKFLALTIHYDPDNYGWKKQVELLDQYEKDLVGNQDLIAYRDMIKRGIEHEKKSQRTAVGKPFIDFTATSLEGEKIALSDVVAKNKYTLIEFWASWCGPCRGSFPHLKKVYAQYKDKGFEVYGISLDTKEDAYLKACEEENLPWINTVDYEGFKSKAAQEYAITAIPWTILVGQDGIIVASGPEIRGLALDEKLKELFADKS